MHLVTEFPVQALQHLTALLRRRRLFHVASPRVGEGTRGHGADSHVLTDEINTRATYRPTRETPRVLSHRTLLGTNAATRLAVRTGAAAGRAEDIGLGPFGVPKIRTRVNNGRLNWKAAWKGAVAEEKERESLRRVTAGKWGREPNPVLVSVSGSRKEHRM